MNKLWAEMVMGRNGYGPKWSWAEMVMGRNDPESAHDISKSLYLRAFMVPPMVPMVDQYRSRFYQWYHW